MVKKAEYQMFGSVTGWYLGQDSHREEMAL
jgi:hypothetical protein